MSKEHPGFFRRLLSGIGSIFNALRWLVNMLFFLVFLGILVSFFSADVGPLPDSAPLELAISGVLVEERTYADPITQVMEQSAPYDSETPIRDLIEPLRKASSDPRITGVILNLNHLQGGGIAKLSEVGEAINDFKRSGKPVIAYADNYSQEQYFLASYADEIIVNAMGGVLFTGFGYYGSYLKEAAEKLKINVHVFKVGKFKSAVEPFTRNDMSDEARENTRDWIDSLWGQYTVAIERNRKLPAGTVNAYANDLPALLEKNHGDLGSLALDSRLVDQVLPRTQVTAKFQGLFGVDGSTYLSIPHKVYLSHLRLPTLDSDSDSENNIGLIVASGTIVDGEQMEGGIGGDSLARLLQLAQEDKTLKALVIRVDSPGGSAFASDVIRQEIVNTQKLMPVIVSMGSLAASGGYWIAAGADEIWAQPATLTGSIGVFGIFPTFEESLAAMGIHNDGVGTTRLADLYHLDRPVSEDASKVIQLSVNNTYQQFLKLVADGRNSTPEAVNEIAGGRIWTGQQAKDNGLVDNLGNLDDAVAAAATRVGLQSWTVKPVARPLSFQEEFLKQMAEGAVSATASMFNLNQQKDSPLAKLAAILLAEGETISALNDPRGLYLQCFNCPN